MPMNGWIAGTSCETLPMSVEARFIRAATLPFGEGAAEGDGVGPVGGQCVLVCTELRVRLALRLDPQFAAGGHGTGLEVAPHPWFDLGQLGQGLRADVPAPRGVVGSRVGCVAAVGDDAVHPELGGQRSSPCCPPARTWRR